MVRIVADTSTLYSTAQARAAGFAVSALSVTIAGKSYREFDEISAEEFVDIIRQGHMPTSSQPAIGQVEALYNAYAARGLHNMALIVDANHANSAKKYMEQPRICKEVLHSCRHSESIRSMVKGFMIESYLESGSQKIGQGIYGKSITDPCIGWNETQKLVLDIAELI